MATLMSLAIVTPAEAGFVGSALLVAVTCTLAGDGKSPGAVYTPAVVIVPTVAFPPETPFTLQLTVVSVLFFTVAVNVMVFPSSTEPLDGATATVICGGGGGGGCTKPAPLTQPHAQAHTARSVRKAMLASGVLPFFCWERGRMPSELQAKGQRKQRGWEIGVRG